MPGNTGNAAKEYDGRREEFMQCLLFPKGRAGRRRNCQVSSTRGEIYLMARLNHRFYANAKGIL
jgi:hypothetical protein